MTEDFYDLLEVSEDASQSEIKSAFREQVRVYHPDLNDDDRAQAQFTAVKTAYDILGDPTERQAYDRLGHEDYVAKRTSGLPSADVWQSDSGSSSTDSSTTQETASASAGTSSTAGATSTSTGSSRRSRTSTASSDGGGRATANGGQATGSYGSYGHQEQSAFDKVVSWWHRRSFAWPLIYTATLIYLGGLGHYALEHEAALASLRGELEAAGADPAAIWAILGESRHGLATPVGYLETIEPVTAPLAGVAWLGALGGIVLLSLVIVVAARLAWRRDTWGPITLDETIVVAIALTVAGTLYGGPLAAGAILMPLLFGVIVHRTRQLPGWGPSYLYVLAVSTPLAGLIALEAGVPPSLQWELAIFVLVPVLGAIGLPLRVQIRKRLGR